MTTDWISVKDRLPDKKAEYLVRIDYGEIYTTTEVADYYPTKKQWDVDVEMGAIVTHWMPLPEPPEDDNDNRLD